MGFGGAGRLRLGRSGGRTCLDDDGGTGVGHERLAAAEQSPSWFGPAGYMVSTATDLGRFGHALFGGELISAELLTQMRTPGVSGYYGLGAFMMGTDPCGNPERLWGNRGNGIGSKSYLIASYDGSRVAAMTWTGADTDIPNDRLNATMQQTLGAALLAACPR
ncbi:serine hydrolase [Nocardia sp. bgisy134]|uniref:serine hydrolase n=1 Tax=Nocardia sp. bgisy134 TaxID=3413789 RepID=UPI003D74302F